MAWIPLLWLWLRPVATAPIQPLAWEPPYAEGAAQEMAKRQKKCIYIYLYVCMYVFMSVCIYIFMCVCVYIYIYIFYFIFFSFLHVEVPRLGV